MKNPRENRGFGLVKLLLLETEILQKIGELATLLGVILSGAMTAAKVFSPSVLVKRFGFIGFKVLLTHKCALLRMPAGDFD
ncbi:hypothetical protein IJF86_03005 [Candidatus Saccharibacteria bacterium]|nr:hypothetical protein [Candidatus Saccharibacteria bacterium]